MSGLLRLSSAVAAVSLLRLGNGVPDVFASVVSFVGNGNGEVWLNSVLGGAVLVTCVVVGVVAICLGDQARVSFVVAVMFVSMYVVYAVFVAANEIVEKHVRRLKMDIPLRVGNIFSQEDDSVQTSLLDEHERHLWGWQDDGIEVDQPWSSFWKVCSLLEFPLTIPRRLTIPLIEEETWSKPYAVASASFSPLLLAFIWNTQDDLSSLSRKLVYLLRSCCPVSVFLSVRLAGATGILPLAGLSKS
ncbi:cation/calcium exchanger 4-like protein [Tanacetum coccineum]|uniref:Cation/calcium exchanger 4-like protein n=1 Tax=Tanacetum coccineum TaxID=301880 RepID=A0ABQ5FIT8_9ASTR